MCLTEYIEKDSEQLNNQIKQPPLLRNGIIIGCGISFVVFLFLTLGTLKATEQERYTNGSTTLTNPLTQTTFSKIFKGKACSFESGCILDAAIFLGGINDNSASLFVDFLEKNIDIKTVCFGSSGGEIGAAMVMSNYMAQRKLSTCISEYFHHDKTKENLVFNYCSSSCNQVFLSSHDRIRVGEQVRFKGHGYASSADYLGSFFGTSTLWKLSHSRVIENQKFIDAIERVNTSDKAVHISYANTVASINHFEQMKVLTNETLKTYKIFTRRM